jgi:hypothetical protein
MPECDWLGISVVTVSFFEDEAEHTYQHLLSKRNGLALRKNTQPCGKNEKMHPTR